MSYFKDNKLKGWIILLLPLIIFNAVLFIFKTFVAYPSVDIPAHIIGGATVALIGFLIYSKKTKIVLSWTFVILMLWEGFEMVGWRLFPKLSNCAYIFCHTDVFFWDGFWDVVIGMAAAAIIALIFFKWNVGAEKNG